MIHSAVCGLLTLGAVIGLAAGAVFGWTAARRDGGGSG